MSDFFSDDELLAAIDLGSNSFHLAIARLDHGEVRKVASMSEKVQLAAGLDEDNMLSQEAKQRGLDCLSRFVGRLDAVMPCRTRIVATNALRQAENAQEFITEAQHILPKPIEVIAGREEARLIYLGVSHTNASSSKRLVVDIGGGSTELIIGEGFEPIHTESMQMGCVAFTKMFFDDGKIKADNYKKAVDMAKKELLSIIHTYKATGWDSVVGSSGTIKAVKQIAVNLNLSNEQEEVDIDTIHHLRKAMFNYKHVDDIEFAGLKENRKAVFPAGLAILQAVFECMAIDKLTYSDGALREGVLYDLLGRFKNEDVRDRSVQAMMARYHVDLKQAERVAKTAEKLFHTVAKPLNFTDEDAHILRWAAQQHEIGLSISHSGYHKHSAYLLAHSDVPGFSQVDQARMSQLVLNHRRKLKADNLKMVQMVGNEKLANLCLLLRLAVVIHHSRSDDVANVSLSVTMPSDKKDKSNKYKTEKFAWCVEIHDSPSTMPMLLSDLTDECMQFKNWGHLLTISHNGDDITPEQLSIKTQANQLEKITS